MVANMHPRSRVTTGLFGTTLAVSFLVVGLPHVLPCPVPRKTFADTETSEDGRRRRKNRQSQLDSGLTQSGSGGGNVLTASEAELPSKEEKRECPVPKPGGFIGKVLGFKEKDQQPESVEVKVEARR